MGGSLPKGVSIAFFSAAPGGSAASGSPKMKGAFAKLSEMKTGTDEEAQASSSASAEPASKKPAPAALGKAAAAVGK